MRNLCRILTALSMLICNELFAQTKTNVAPTPNKITAAADTFQKRYSPEKVYLHIDKPTYFMGDTLWFKAYVFDAQTMAAATKSQRLYIELNDDSLINVKRIAIPIRYGVGWGQIPLSAKQLREGNYTVRAYTQWMQNLDEDRFFKQRVYIGNPATQTWQIKSATERLTDEQGNEKMRVVLKLSTMDNQPIGNRKVQLVLDDKERTLRTERQQTTADGTLQLTMGLNSGWLTQNLRMTLVDMESSSRHLPLHIPINFNRPELIDLQFFPEGGKMVGGIPTALAFKAINEDGFGADVSGAIYNEDNVAVASFKTQHKGMGRVQFTPVAGQKYTARIFTPANATQKYKLPDVEKDGTVLQVNIGKYNKDSIEVRPQFGGNALQKNGYHLVAEARGKIYFEHDITTTDTLIKADRLLFPEGIVHFTLFSQNTPVNERLLYVTGKNHLEVSVTPFPPEDSNLVVLGFDIKDANGKPVNEGAFSVSVTNNNLLKADEQNNNGINYWSNLRSELKGYIEEPAWYFTAVNKEKETALDNLMLTQGWTGLNWQKVFDDKEPEFYAEKGIEVSGRVVNSFNKPIAGAQVLLTSQHPDFLLEAVTDKMGRYSFDKLPLLDTPLLFVMARTDKNKELHYGELEVNKFTPPTIVNEALPGLPPWYTTTDKITHQWVNNALEYNKRHEPKLTGRVLEEVKINAKKRIPNSYNSNGADIVLDATDIKETGTVSLYDLLRTAVPGFKIVMREGFPAVMIDNYYAVLLLDGFGLRLYDIETYVPTIQSVVEALKNQTVSSYTGVEVLYSNKYVRQRPQSTFQPLPSAQMAQMARDARGGTLMNGYDAQKSNFQYTSWRVQLALRRDRPICKIYITTKGQTGVYDMGNSRPNHTLYRPTGFSFPKQFYNPPYKVADDGTAPLPQPTIYWKPDVVTDGKGKAIVSFYAPPKPWNFTINVQGADLSGNVGGNVSLFNFK